MEDAKAMLSPAIITRNILAMDNVASLIADFSSVDTLFALRHSCKTFKTIVDSDLNDKEWLARITYRQIVIASAFKVPIASLPAIKVKNRLTLICLLESRCMLCGQQHGERFINSLHGCYGHVKCIRKRLVSLETLVGDLEAIDSNRFNRNATHIGIILIREEYFHALGAHYDSLLWERLGLDSLMWEMPRW